MAEPRGRRRPDPGCAGPGRHDRRANLLAVVATARTRSAPSDTRVRDRSGDWLSLRAAPLVGPSEGRDVVVTVDPIPRPTLSRLALAAHGLTAREEDVAVLVLTGADTRAIAGALHLSQHTVRDHLEAVSAKLGVTSRRDMTARLVLDRATSAVSGCCVQNARLARSPRRIGRDTRRPQAEILCAMSRHGYGLARRAVLQLRLAGLLRPGPARIA